MLIGYIVYSLLAKKKKKSAFMQTASANFLYIPGLGLVVVCLGEEEGTPELGPNQDTENLIAPPQHLGSDLKLDSTELLAATLLLFHTCKMNQNIKIKVTHSQLLYNYQYLYR